MLPTQTLSHKMSVLYFNYILCQLKKAIILLHIILPFLEFLTSRSGRPFLCFSRTGLNIKFQANLLASLRKKQSIHCQTKQTKQLLKCKPGMKNETLFSNNIAIGRIFTAF